MDPTQAGYLSFIRNVMGIEVQYLPDNSPAIAITYNVAIMLVNQGIKLFGTCPGGDPTLPSLYALAVYNLAADRLITWAPDQTGVVFKTVDNQEYGYFAWARKQFNSNGFTPGVIQSTNDLTTGGSFVVPEAFKYFTIRDLQNTKTPYGQAYLEIAMDWGPNDWGIS